MQRDSCPRCKVHFSHPVHRNGERRASFDGLIIEPMAIGEAAKVEGRAPANGPAATQRRKRKNRVGATSDEEPEESEEEEEVLGQRMEDDEIDELAGESLEVVPRPAVSS